MTRKKIFPLLLIGLLSVLQSFLPLHAQETGQGIGGINLSLWPGIATQRLDTVNGKTFLNIGIASKMNQLTGIGINVLGSTTLQSVNGIQASGLFNVIGNELRGWQAAGIANIIGEDMTGLSASGLVGIVGEKATGLMVSGAMNIVGNGYEGIMASGLINIASEQGKGVQLAGLSNVSESVSGIQAAGFLNVAGGDVQGVQLASLINIAAEDMTGLQAGMLNVATNVRGIQLGLVNYYHKHMDGFQLGLVNANSSTRLQLLVSAGTSTLLQTGIRFKNRTYYTVLGIGSKYLHMHAFNTAFTYRAGLAHPVADKLELSGDLGYQHIETFRGKRNQVNRLVNLQARLNLEYQMRQDLNVFFTAGYERAYTYHGNKFRNGIFAEVGTAFLLGNMSEIIK